MFRSEKIDFNYAQESNALILELCTIVENSIKLCDAKAFPKTKLFCERIAAVLKSWSALPMSSVLENISERIKAVPNEKEKGGWLSPDKIHPVGEQLKSVYDIYTKGGKLEKIKAIEAERAETAEKEQQEQAKVLAEKEVSTEKRLSELEANIKIQKEETELALQKNKKEMEEKLEEEKSKLVFALQENTKKIQEEAEQVMSKLLAALKRSNVKIAQLPEVKQVFLEWKPDLALGEEFQEKELVVSVAQLPQQASQLQENAAVLFRPATQRKKLNPQECCKNMESVMQQGKFNIIQKIIELHGSASSSLKSVLALLLYSECKWRKQKNSAEIFAEIKKELHKYPQLQRELESLEEQLKPSFEEALAVISGKEEFREHAAIGSYYNLLKEQSVFVDEDACQYFNALAWTQELKLDSRKEDRKKSLQKALANKPLREDYLEKFHQKMKELLQEQAHTSLKAS